jgi:hypothetical protein
MITRRYDLVMAIFPNARGFAHVVFEGPLSPVDWGMSDVYGTQKNRACAQLISKVLRRHRPDTLLIREVGEGAPRTNRRLAALVRQIELQAEETGAVIVRVSRDQVREAFGHLGATTRYDIVLAISKLIPMFESFVPPMRKLWKSEDRRMGLFDAAALALTFFGTGGPSNDSTRS